MIEGARGDGWIACLRAALAYAISVFGIGFALGAIRILVLVPRIGTTAAVMLEAPLMLAASWILSKAMTGWFRVEPRVAARVLMGSAAFLFLMCLEFALAGLVFGRSAREFVLQFATAPGMIGLAAQVGFGIFPIVQARSWRGAS